MDKAFLSLVPLLLRNKFPVLQWLCREKVLDPVAATGKAGGVICRLIDPSTLPIAKTA